jgi:hypothetical protein
MTSARLAAAVGAAAATVCLAATPALAAPDQSATLDAAHPSFAWDGGPGFGVLGDEAVSKSVPCDTPGYDCELVLVRTTEPGNIDFSIAGDGAPTTHDIDLHVYFSDKDGTQGDLIGEGISSAPDEAVATGDVDPGYYLAKVDYYLSVAGTYKGTAAFTPSEG